MRNNPDNRDFSYVGGSELDTSISWCLDLGISMLGQISVFAEKKKSLKRHFWNSNWCLKPISRKKKIKKNLYILNSRCAVVLPKKDG